MTPASILRAAAASLVAAACACKSPPPPPPPPPPEPVTLAMQVVPPGHIVLTLVQGLLGEGHLEGEIALAGPGVAVKVPAYAQTFQPCPKCDPPAHLWPWEHACQDTCSGERFPMMVAAAPLRGHADKDYPSGKYQVTATVALRCDMYGIPCDPSQPITVKPLEVEVGPDGYFHPTPERP